MAALRGADLSGVFRVDGDDVVLAVRAQPGAKAPGFDGAAEGPGGRVFLKIRLRAKAEDGAANAELLSVLAKALKRPKSAIRLESGETARFKSVRIAGDSDAVAARLKELMS
ncbi:MAG: DUF167 domain-containing protein [Micropepsaceae bacterium]